MPGLIEVKKLHDALDFPFLDDADENLQKHLKAINSGITVEEDPKPDPIAMGDNDIKNVYYVNFNPKGLSKEAQADIVIMNRKLELNTNWLSVRAGAETAKKMKEGTLPGDMSVDSQIKRGTYRAAVIDYLMGQSSWMGGYGNAGVTRKFSVAKAEFHTQLLTTFLEGMSLNPSVYGALEGLLQMISDSIFQSSRSSQKTMFYLLSTVYIWDEIMQMALPTVRTFYFEANGEVKTYVAGKTTIQTVNVTMGWYKSDAIFNVDLWDNGIGDGIKKYLTAEGKEIINKPIDIPVDP